MVVGRTILSPAMGLCTLADANIEICMSYTQVQGFDVGTPDQMWTFFHFGVKSPKNEWPHSYIKLSTRLNASFRTRQLWFVSCASSWRWTHHRRLAEDGGHRDVVNSCEGSPMSFWSLLQINTSNKLSNKSTYLSNRSCLILKEAHVLLPPHPLTLGPVYWLRDGW